MEALAVFLQAMRLLAVASPVVDLSAGSAGFLLVEGAVVDFGLKSCGVSFKRALHGLLPLALMSLVIAAAATIAVVTVHAGREALAV